jgi:hypothetical protein
MRSGLLKDLVPTLDKTPSAIGDEPGDAYRPPFSQRVQQASGASFERELCEAALQEEPGQHALLRLFALFGLMFSRTASLFSRN